MSPEGKSDQPYDGGDKAEKAEGIVTRAKVSEYHDMIHVKIRGQNL